MKAGRKSRLNKLNETIHTQYCIYHRGDRAKTDINTGVKWVLEAVKTAFGEGCCETTRSEPGTEGETISEQVREQVSQDSGAVGLHAGPG